MERRKKGRKEGQEERTWTESESSVCTKGERPKGRGTRLLPSARREREKEKWKEKDVGGLRRRRSYVRKRERKREGRRRKVSNGSALTSSLAPIPSLARLSFIVATEEDQYGPRGV